MFALYRTDGAVYNVATWSWRVLVALFYCGSYQSYVIKFMYYETIKERCVPVENVTAVVFLLILYRYQLQFGGAKGPPSTFPLMKVWTSDGTLSSGHVSGSLGSRLEIGFVGSDVGRLPDVQQSTQWPPVSVVARSGLLGVLSTLLVCVGDGLGSIAAIRAFDTCSFPPLSLMHVA
jgi:hypothetical protein